MILITAFEPFGGKTINTSAEVLRLLPGRIAGQQVKKLLLPVAYGRAAEKVMEHSADSIFLLGEAGGRRTVTPETRAVNQRKAAIADNAGKIYDGAKIDPDGSEVYQTRIEVEHIVERMRAEGFVISPSHDAGTYVCNDTFYLVGTRSACPVDFIHVPHREEDIAELAKTVERYIEIAIGKPTAQERMMIREERLTPEGMEQLIQLSRDWEAEESCFGYRANTPDDIEGNRVFTAREKGRIIGYLFGHLFESENMRSIMPEGTKCFEVEELYVIPERRSEGIGRKLFDYVSERLQGDATYLVLSTATKNWRAILHFYIEEMGMDFWSARLYKRIGEREEDGRRLESDGMQMG